MAGIEKSEGFLGSLREGFVDLLKGGSDPLKLIKEALDGISLDGVNGILGRVFGAKTEHLYASDRPSGDAYGQRELENIEDVGDKAAGVVSVQAKAPDLAAIAAQQANPNIALDKQYSTFSGDLPGVTQNIPATVQSRGQEIVS